MNMSIPAKYYIFEFIHENLNTDSYHLSLVKCFKFEFMKGHFGDRF